jgi:hypothetical protein
MNQHNGIISVAAILALLGSGVVLTTMDLEHAWYCGGNDKVAFNVQKLNNGNRTVFYLDAQNATRQSTCKVAWIPAKQISILNPRSQEDSCGDRWVGNQKGWWCE